MVDDVKKWQDIVARRKKIEPYLEALRADLPQDTSQWTDEHKLVGAQIALIESTDKPDVMQRGIEHLAKIKKLTVTGIDKGDDARRSRELEENMVKAAQTFQQALELRSKPAPEDPDA